MRSCAVKFSFFFLLPFLGYIKSEESLGVNTEGGLSGPELEML